MTQTLPDMIHLKPDVHRPMSRLYDRPSLQSPVANTYSDIEASLRRRTNMLPGLTLTNLPRTVEDVQQGTMQSTYSDVTTSLLNQTHSTAMPREHDSVSKDVRPGKLLHSTSDAYATTTFSSDVHKSLQPRMTPSKVAVPRCNQVHRRKSEVSLNNPEAHPLFRRF